MAQYERTTWTAKDGAPKNVLAIAQTRDGWLWLAGIDGLYRFDGVRFKRIELEPDGSTRGQHVIALYATKGGQLLVGGFYGGITVIDAGRLKRFRDDKEIGSTVFGFAEGHDGVLWAATRTGLVRFDGTSWKRLPPEWNAPEATFRDLRVDSSGALWVSSTTEILRLAAGAHRFERSSVDPRGFVCFALTPDGRAWVVKNDFDAQLLPEQPAGGTRDPWENSKISAISLFDRDGHLWSTSPLVKNVPNQAATVLEDRAGNLWIGSGTSHLFRFRRKIFTEIVAPKTFHASTFAAGNDGVVWMTRREALLGLDRLDGVWRYDGAWRQMPMARSATAITRSADGTVWVGGTEAVWREGRAGFTKAPELPGDVEGIWARSIAVGPDGKPWISILGKGLLQLSGADWRLNGDLAGLPAAEPHVLTFDPQGRLWLGYGSGNLNVVEGGQARTVATGEALRLGPVMAVSARQHVLVGGERGVSVLRGDHFVPLRASGGNIFRFVTGIAQTGAGEVWLNGGAGAVRIAAGQLDGEVVQGVLDVATEHFDAGDGYPGTDASFGFFHTMSAMPNGDIWLTGNQGVARIDPSRVEHDTTRPPAFIDSVTADGQAIDVTAGAKPGKRTQNLQIDYTALDYAHPDRLRFKYRLTGYEDAWVDAGARRQAFYTKLGPGKYRFEVQAANQLGLWSEQPAAIDFEIPPTFVQTRVFWLLCAAGTLLLLALLYRLRMRQFTARERARLTERLGERERIARELHDTLLQSTQGLMLKFRVHAQEIEADSPARLELERTLRAANEVMIEGRDRVQDLRLAADTADDLPEAVAAVGEELAAGTATSFRTEVEGHVRALRRAVKEEAYRIAREALLNAFRHAQASSIEVQIVFEDDKLRVRIRDDGRGIDPATLNIGGTPGHWGLVGMKERAREMGGELCVWSRPGGGTEIELTVPGNLAFGRSRSRFRGLLRGWP